MDQAVSVEDLQERLVRCLHRYEEINAQIGELLSSDVGAFVRREIKRAFVDHPDVTRTLDDAGVQELKAAAEELATRESARVAADLAVGEVWEHTAEPPENGWSFEGVPSIWSPVRRVGENVQDFLQERGLGDGGPPTYQAPRIFVNGMYLPTLGEHHWRLRGELIALRAQGATLQDREDRVALAERWDSA